MSEVTLSTTTQVAERFHVDPSTVRDWAHNGTIPFAAKTPGGHYRFDMNAVAGSLQASVPERSEVAS